MGFFPWDIRIAFPGESQLRQSRIRVNHRFERRHKTSLSPIARQRDPDTVFRNTAQESPDFDTVGKGITFLWLFRLCPPSTCNS